MKKPQRSVSTVPRPLRAALLLALAIQVALAMGLPSPQPKASALPSPPSIQSIELASLGENIAASQGLALYLQAFDNQPGISVPFAQLNYDRVEAWLTRMLELDPSAQYPLLLATHVYAQVPDEAKQRQMLDFAYRQFFAAPDQRWQWLAHAAIMAKHRLHDLPLALKYAQAIAQRAKGPGVPSWVQQMPIFILEEMGEVESAKILLGGLLANNTVTDPREKRFLIQRLHELETRTVEKSSPMSKRRQDQGKETTPSP